MIGRSPRVLAPADECQRVARRPRFVQVAHSLSSAAEQAWLRSALVGLVVAILACSTTPSSLKPSDVIDYDYRGALQWAALHQQPFGHHFVFTYGPLGFISWPTLFFGFPAALGFLFTTAIAAVSATVVFRFLRPSLAPVPAFAAAYVATAIISVSPDSLISLGLVGALTLTRERSERAEMVGFA